MSHRENESNAQLRLSGIQCVLLISRENGVYEGTLQAVEFNVDVFDARMKSA